MTSAREEDLRRRKKQQVGKAGESLFCRDRSGRLQGTGGGLGWGNFFREFPSKNLHELRGSRAHGVSHLFTRYPHFCFKILPISLSILRFEESLNYDLMLGWHDKKRNYIWTFSFYINSRAFNGQRSIRAGATII